MVDSVIRTISRQCLIRHIDHRGIQSRCFIHSAVRALYHTGDDTPSNVTYVVDSLNEDNAADFTINDTGEADWHIQLKQTGVKLEQGQWYRLSLKMKSSIDRKVSYALQRDGSTHKNADGNEDWTPYCQETVDLTGEYQTITKEFQMKEDTDPETIFNIAMGAVGGEQITQQHRICMDDIVLEKIEAPEIKPEEIGKNLLTNGDFSDGTNRWGINTNADQTATTVVTDGGIVFQVKNPGENDWDVQLNQHGFTLEKGCKYRVKFTTNFLFLCFPQRNICSAIPLLAIVIH